MQKTTNEALGRPSAEKFGRMEKMPVMVVLDSVRSMNNVGSFFRTCDAFAVRGICLCGITACPPHKKIHKTALGAELTVPWRRFDCAADAVEQLRAEGYTAVAVEQAAGAVALQDFTPEPGRAYALVFGNEVAGVAQQVIDRCDMAVEIPQLGTKHSLNVAVSGGVLLWRFFEHFISGTR